MKLDFSERQANTIEAALTLVAALVIAAALLFSVKAFAYFYSSFSNVFNPLLVAFVVALVLKPYYRFFQEKLRLPKGAAVLSVYLTVLLPIAAVLWFFGGMLIDEGVALVNKVPELQQQAISYVKTKAPVLERYWTEYGVQEKILGFMEDKGGHLLKALRQMVTSAASASASAFQMISGWLGWVVFPVYLAFLMIAEPLRKKQWESLLPFLKEETRTDVIYLGQEFVNILVSFFRGQFIVALLQGLLFGIGFTLIGLQYGFVLGLTLGLLNIIPYLGSMIGLSVAIPLAFFQPDGGAMLLALVLLTFTIVQCIEGYILTPKIMGDRTGLHPLVIMVALFFWGSVFGGIMGMVLAIPLTAFAVVFWRLANTKYIQEIV